MSSESRQLDDFAQQARAFCRWATGTDGTPMIALAALRQVSSLYSAALNLPSPFTEGMSEIATEVEPPSDLVRVVSSRASELPLQFYWKVSDPVATPCEEPVAGWIVGDLAEIYQDVAHGLVLFEAGNREEARWEWAFNFRIHWGEHATAVLRALHAYLAQENPDGLSRDA
ncbi:MAG: DUF5063 domain-containing protein [Acidobacteriota bacterium]